MGQKWPFGGRSSKRCEGRGMRMPWSLKKHMSIAMPFPWTGTFPASTSSVSSGKRERWLVLHVSSRKMNCLSRKDSHYYDVTPLLRKKITGSQLTSSMEKEFFSSGTNNGCIFGKRAQMSVKGPLHLYSNTNGSFKVIKLGRKRSGRALFCYIHSHTCSSIALPSNVDMERLPYENGFTFRILWMLQWQVCLSTRPPEIQRALWED